ncbi:RHS repeat domain-containing protein, partial [Chitinimonas sp. JJ19]|uniref:RHS repeat domain-containing protein n=1 Tax=Chitinimonas sp. JJ19 TaxID=3109352 RepID=UPI003001D1DB
VYYHYDQSRHLIAESDGQGRTVKEYLYLDELPVALVWEGRLYAIHPDHLGTPRLVTDSQRRARWLWHSEPFGSTAPQEDPEQLGQPLVLNVRFAGQYHDGESGLFYNGFRDYDPRTGS